MSARELADLRGKMRTTQQAIDLATMEREALLSVKKGLEGLIALRTFDATSADHHERACGCDRPSYCPWMIARESGSVLQESEPRP